MSGDSGKNSWNRTCSDLVPKKNRGSGDSMKLNHSFHAKKKSRRSRFWLVVLIWATFFYVSTSLGAELEIGKNRLEGRLNPLSPNCGVEIIEIGREKNGQFETHLGLLRDTYDESYPGVLPKIRKIYDYSLIKAKDQKRAENHLEEDPQLPKVIISRSGQKWSSLLRVFHKVAQVFAIVNPYPSMSVVTEHILSEVFKSNKYYRDRASYLLKLVIENPQPSVTQLLATDELKEILAVVPAYYKASGLWLKHDLRAFVYDYQQEQRANYKKENYDRLVKALKKENLKLKPLYRDFVLVYESKGKKDIPVAIYGLSQQKHPELTLDLKNTNRVKNQKRFRTLNKLALRFGTLLIPFPARMIVKLAGGGLQVALSHEGHPLFIDNIQSEAELAALIDSGILEIDLMYINQIKSQLEEQKTGISTLREPRMAQNRKLSQEMMDRYLRTSVKTLCKKVAKKREKEYRKKYLTFGKRWKRRFQAILGKFSKKKRTQLIEQRRQVILERRDLVEARVVVESFHQAKIKIPSEMVIEALKVLAQHQESKGARLMLKLLDSEVPSELKLQIVELARIHGSKKFLDPFEELLEELESIQPGQSTGSERALKAKLIQTIDQIKRRHVSLES